MTGLNYSKICELLRTLQ